MILKAFKDLFLIIADTFKPSCTEDCILLYKTINSSVQKNTIFSTGKQKLNSKKNHLFGQPFSSLQILMLCKPD